MWHIKTLCVFFLGIFCCAKCYTFLGVFPIPIKSHIAVFKSLMKELSKKGHNVTVVSTFPEKDFLSNYKDIDLSEYIPKYIEVVNLTATDADSKLSRYLTPGMISDQADVLCEGMSSAPFQNFIKQQSVSYDAIILENFNTDCFLAVAHKIKAPVIGFSSSGILPWSYHRYGSPTNPSYMPSIFLALSDQMNFFERVENTLFTLYTHLFYQFYRLVKDKEVVRKYIGSDATDLETLAINSSLFLVNTHFTLNLPRPFSPNVIEVGGIHIKEPKPLTKDLRKWIEDSPNGVIYFSMGSMILGKSMPKDKLFAFISAFELLPQRVIWKWESDTMEGKSEKILLQKWVPQFDVLCHPNVKLFISHGGLLGIMEAVFCGVPVVVVPQFGDQPSNAKALEAVGGGVTLLISEVTEETAFNAMLKAFHLRDKVKSLSNRFKDRPLSPLDTAVYWTEYVVRQKGAHFMKSSVVDLPFYQYYLIDVIVFLFSVLLVIIYCVFFTFKILIRIFDKLIFIKRKKD